MCIRDRFAADLWQVFKGNAAPEYRDPKEFFRRTFLTAGLRELIVSAIHRWRKEAGGSPVVELQTTCLLYTSRCV